MNRLCKTRKYLAIFSGILVLFLYSWIEPVVYLCSFLQLKGAPDLSQSGLFLNVMGTNGNFINDRKIVVLYLIVLVFSISYLFFSDKHPYIIRLKSRNSYVHKHIIDSLLFSFIFVFLIEIINVTGAFIVFGADIVFKFNLILYSALDFITLLLFYFRAGILLFITGVIMNKKLAPFVTSAIFLIEYFSTFFIRALKGIWLPFKDSISVTNLIMGNIQPIDTVPAIIRGLIMDAVLLWFAYFIFRKKDILGNEKK